MGVVTVARSKPARFQPISRPRRGTPEVQLAHGADAGTEFLSQQVPPVKVNAWHA